MTVTSPSNSTIKAIRSLRRRRERDETKRYWIEGIRLVREAVETASEIECAVVAPELLRAGAGLETVEMVRALPVEVLEVAADVFRSISSKDGPQGLGAVVRQRWLTLPDIRGDEGLCWVALDRIADPGNLGSILRTCDAVGAAGVILLGETTDPYDPASVRGSMGAICSLRLVRAEVEAFASWVQERSINLVGTTDRAETSYREATYDAPLAILSGSEREGLPPPLLEICKETVSIPMVGRADSLNVSVATALVLYQAFGTQPLVAHPL